ncbi:hypothetical protein HZB01_00905 [Candidatus Woesearchaeota archaeon]|nr:hypothetical protein [Candidatus Woesearchaeota archaeon]
MSDVTATLEYRLLQRLNSAPTASFKETEVNKVIVAFLNEHFHGNPKVTALYDHYGNLVIHYKGDKNREQPKVLAFDLHTDHPAFHTKPLDKGMLEAGLMGGFDEEAVVGSLAHLHAYSYGGNYTPHGTGLFTERLSDDRIGNARYLLEAEDKAHAVRGIAIPVLEGVDPVNPVTYDPKTSLITAPVMDNLASVAMSLAAFKEVVDADLDVDVYLLCNKAEEVGYIGAYGLLQGSILPKDALVVCVETSSYVKKGGEDGALVQIATPGQGYIHRTADGSTPFWHPDVTVLLDVADQTLPHIDMTGGVCQGTLYLASEYRTGATCIALKGYHNGLYDGNGKFVPEKVHADDFMQGKRFLVMVARTLAENPGLYEASGSVTLTEKQQTIPGRVGEWFAGYAREGFLKKQDARVIIL